MDGKPRISVIVLTFERPDLLEVCVESIRENLVAQIRDNWDVEIIIGDDGSQDKATEKSLSTMEMIERLAPDKVFRNERKAEGKGPGYTLNEMDKLAEGEYIIFLEDDFWMIKPMPLVDLHACVDALKTVPDLGLVRLRQIIGDNGHIARLDEYWRRTEVVSHLFGGRTFRVLKSRENGGTSYQYTGNAHLRNRDLIEKVGRFPEDVSIWQLENNYNGQVFMPSGVKTGRFLDGWFSHLAKETTAAKDSSFGGRQPWTKKK